MRLIGVVRYSLYLSRQHTASPGCPGIPGCPFCPFSPSRPVAPFFPGVPGCPWSPCEWSNEIIMYKSMLTLFPDILGNFGTYPFSWRSLRSRCSRVTNVTLDKRLLRVKVGNNLKKQTSIISIEHSLLHALNPKHKNDLRTYSWWAIVSYRTSWPSISFLSLRISK